METLKGVSFFIKNERNIKFLESLKINLFKFIFVRKNRVMLPSKDILNRIMPVELALDF